MNPINLFEAYHSIYNEEFILTEEYDAIDQLSDEELLAILEEVIEEEGYDIDESVEYIEELTSSGLDWEVRYRKERLKKAAAKAKDLAGKVGSAAKRVAKKGYEAVKSEVKKRGLKDAAKSLLSKGLRKGAALARKAASKLEPTKEAPKAEAPKAEAPKKAKVTGGGTRASDRPEGHKDGPRTAKTYRGDGVGRKEAVGKTVKAAAAEKVKAARKPAPYRGAGAGSKETASSGGISSKGGEMGAEGKKGTALPAAKKTKGGRLPNKGNYSMRRDMHNRKLAKKLGEDYDALAEYILDDIMEQGYADTYEEALVILESMTDYEIGDIAEDFVLLSEEIEMDEATAMAKRGLDEPAIRNQIAKDTAKNTSGSGAAADRAKALAGRETYGDADTKHQRGDFARKRMIAHRRATSTDTSLRGYGHQSNDPAVKAKQAARGAQRGSASLTPAERKQLNMGEEFDTFDVVLEYLYVEGYAESMEDAESIMVYLEPEAVEAIAESGWHRRNPDKIGTSADPDMRMSRTSSVPRNSAASKSPERTPAERKSDRRVVYDYYGKSGREEAIKRAKAERDAARERRRNR